MKRYYHWLAPAGLFILIVFLSVVGYMWYHRWPAKAPSAPTSNLASPSPTAGPALDRLQIEAIRARSYSGSAITLEQSLGTQAGGYTNAVVSYRSDGLKIYALMSTPAGSAPSGGWPVIILDHGYINPVTYRTTGTEYQSFIAAFTQAGYMVIKPDYRGHGQSEGTPEGGHFSPVYAYDNLNLIATLKQYPSVNAGRIGLFGHSLGGHVALRTIVASPDIKATVFAAGVVGSFDDIFYKWPKSPMADDLPQIVQTKRQEYIAQYGEPKTNPDFWNSLSAVNYVKNITGAVQVNHSVGDSTVPVAFSDRLVAALQAAGKAPEYHQYPGDDHQFSVSRAAFLRNVVQFYQAHL